MPALNWDYWSGVFWGAFVVAAWWSMFAVAKVIRDEGRRQS